jgi:pimeloyl-ACP methyl ester carboxylesterase
MPNNLKNIEIDGRQLHYVEQGDGQPVIFIHGGLDDYRTWQFQIDSFSRKYRAISYSRRFAHPNKWIGNVVTDNIIEENAKDLAELIRKLDLAPAHLVGHSYGAFTTLYCVYRNPELAKTIVLCEPPILPFLAMSQLKGDVELVQGFRAHVQNPTEDAFKREDFKKAVQAFIDGIMETENFFVQLPEEGRQPIMDNAKSLEGELESAMPSSFTVEEVKQISIPTLLIKGERSPKFLLRIVDILSENMSNTEQITIPGVGHDLGLMSSPDIFNSKVMQFFARHS